MKSYLVGFIAIILSVCAHAEIKSQVIEYTVDGENFTGYLAYDDQIQSKRPGILVVHEWWGHNDYVRQRADQLAQLGYTAFALDMYGTGKVAQHPADAKKFMQAVVDNMAAAQKRFEAGYNILRNHASVETEQIAAIGYCFGGSTVLHMARQGVDLDGVVSFHGTLATETPAQNGQVNAELLVLTGADDPMVPSFQVDAFREEMTDANVSFKLYSYPGVTHAFTNPAADELGKRFNMPLAYDAGADADSWSKMREFLNEIFVQEQ